MNQIKHSFRCAFLFIIFISCANGEEELISINLPVLTSTYEDDCSSELQDFNAEIMSMGRISAASDAFVDCVNIDIESKYQQCIGDPFFNAPIETQIEKVISISNSTNNTNMYCSGGGGIASASLGKFAHEGNENFKWSDWIDTALSRLDAELCKPGETPKLNGCRFKPYPWPYSSASGTIWHEVTHTHGYTHGANGQANAKQACGYANSPTWNYQRNTMPYILGNCIKKVINQSANVCGVIDDCLLPNSLRVVNHFNGQTCSCVTDPARIGLELFRQAPLANGVYTIKQKSSGRYMDAFQKSEDGFNAVTRKQQSNDTQKWVLTIIGKVYTVQQQSNNSYLGAYQTSSADYSVVTHISQTSDAEKWVVLPADDISSTIQQLSSSRFLDAYEESKDYSVVTRPAQNNTTQQWILSFVESDRGETFKIQQKSSGRFLDAFQSYDTGNNVVTRDYQSDDTQKWTLKPIGAVYTIEQKSSLRLLDAFQTLDKDYSTVTRPMQNNDTQKWVIFSTGRSGYTIQQLSSGMFIDAHESSGKDFSVVTREAQNNDTQQWIINRVDE